MRPLELRLRNFRSYFGDETTFSFRDRSLVGIVGPIGSGKSSILDAIAFALYGKTPTVAAATKGLIHQRAAEAAVALRFEVEDEIWEAVRMLRVKGQSQHALYRLESDVDGAEPVERITMEADVNTKIVELLGLEFDAFGRSVLLAQGRFAEFLRARPVERDKVLKGVFGHDRIDAMRETAKRRGAEFAVELEKLAIRVEQLERIATRLEQRREQRKVLDSRVEDLRKLQPKLDDLDEQIAGDERVVDVSTKRRSDLRDLAGRIPDPSVTKELLADASGVADRRAALGVELEAAQRTLAAADADLAEVEASGLAKRVEEAGQRLSVVAALERSVTEAAGRADTLAERVAAHTASVVDARERRDATAKADAAAASELADRVTAFEQSETTLLDLRHANMATTLRAELHDGDTCPVCAQEVDDVPPAGKPSDVLEAEQAADLARSAREVAENQRVKAAANAQGAIESLAALESEAERLGAEHALAVAAVAEAREEVAAGRAGLVTLLGEGDPAALLDGHKTDLERRRTNAELARKTLERVRSEHDAVIRDQQETAKRLTMLRVDLADLAARLDTDVVTGDDSPESLEHALASLRETWTLVTHELETEITAASERIARGRTERSALFAEFGIEGEFAGVLANAVAEAEFLAKGIAEDQAELDSSASLIEQRNTIEAARARYEQIASDLTDSRFVRYLLDDERTRLAALGSEHFERMSSGRYRFSEDGKFEIIDLTAAEAVRKADSLSGGETFLASLALALALAEMVSRTGGRLDAFFLDEGFGSLDPEHLDLAMEGIEALVADGSDRLVVVVSHVPELQARLEDLIVLDRHPATGDTRVMSA